MARVTVFKRKKLSGWNGEPGKLREAGFGASIPLEHALRKEYDTDAHCSQYTIPGHVQIPRLNQSALTYFQSNERPDSVPVPRLESIFVDIDFPDHESEQYGWHNIDEWPQRWEEWEENIETACDQCPELETAGIYLTRGGMRLLWPLAEDHTVSIFEAAAFLDQFYEYIGNTTLPHDRLTDWNRLFRLPCVVRDGRRTEPNLHLSGMEPLEWRPPEDLTTLSATQSGEAKRERTPEFEDIDDPNKGDLSDLKDQWYYNHLVKGLPLADPDQESRHDTVVSVASSIASVLGTNDPLEVYQLMQPGIRAMINAQESSDRSFTRGEAWRVCVWACEQYDGQQKQEQQRERSFTEEQADAMGCEPEQVRRRLVLYTTEGGTYFVWDEEDKSYSVRGTSQQQLLALLDQHCPELSQVYALEKQSYSELIRRFGTSVARVIFSYTADEFDFDEVMRTLRSPVIERDPQIKAKEHPEIHEWLRLLFNDRVEKGLDWLATFLRFDRMTCALYIHGPPSVGKNLLVNGICRLWRTSPAEYSELSDDFQSALFDSPLVFADEGIPETPFGESGSQIFRRAVGRSSQKVEKKFQSKADLEGAPRIFIAANSADAIQTGESLGPEDIDALRKRIGYIRTDNQAWEYLQEISDGPVQDLTQKWVEGGQIAEHLLWLHKNRDVEIGDRFLVEGWESDLTANLVFQFGAAPEVCRFLVAAFRDREPTEAIHTEESGVWVNAGRLIGDFNRIVSNDLPLPGHGEVLDVLETLSEGEQKPMTLEENGRDVDRRFWKIAPKDIVRAADYYQTAMASTVREAIKQRQQETDEDFSPSGFSEMQSLASGQE